MRIYVNIQKLFHVSANVTHLCQNRKTLPKMIKKT